MVHSFTNHEDFTWYILYAKMIFYFGRQAVTSRLDHGEERVDTIPFPTDRKVGFLRSVWEPEAVWIPSGSPALMLPTPSTIPKHMVVMVAPLTRSAPLFFYYSMYCLYYHFNKSFPIQITFADDEYLIGVNGTVGTYVGITVITSLAFQTNKKTAGPYGSIQGTSFSLPVSNGHIVGFTGNYGDFLDSFGVILHA